MGDMFKVMAASLHEEEQTQRMMVALKEMSPFYPGKSQTEVHSVLEQVRTRRSCDLTPQSCDLTSQSCDLTRFVKTLQHTELILAHFGW